MRAKVEIFVDPDAVAADAGGALDHEAQARLYDTLDWFRLTREHILKDEPFMAVRGRSDAGAAWLFLTESGARRAEPFGSWYTLRFSPIFAGDPEPAERVELIFDIARALKQRFARVTLSPLADDDLTLLKDAFARAGWMTAHGVQTANWIARTAGSDFNAYWSKRPGQLRSTVRRKSGKAGLDIRLLDGFDSEAWSAYEAVFAASWKGEEGSPAFLRALAERAASWGRLRMALAFDASGAPLAAQLWTVDGGVATIHKLAYVDAAKALSPGSILSHAMFRHVIERDRPDVIDFGTGDDPYKADWMDEKRVLHRFDAYNIATFYGLRGYARSRAAALVARRRSA